MTGGAGDVVPLVGRVVPEHQFLVLGVALLTLGIGSLYIGPFTKPDDVGLAGVGHVGVAATVAGEAVLARFAMQGFAVGRSNVRVTGGAFFVSKGSACK